MAMYEEQGRGNESRQERQGQRLGLDQERRQIEQLAQTLSQQSLFQWQRTVEGIVALPAAIAVSWAAFTLYAVGFVTRGFQALQHEASETSQQLRYSFADNGEGRNERRPQRAGENRGPDAAITESQPRA